MKTFAKRKWLNPPKSEHKGHIQWGYKADKYYDCLHLDIADCSRVVSLSIDVTREKDRKNSLKKLRIIRDVCDELITAVKAAKTDGQRRKERNE